MYNDDCRLEVIGVELQVTVPNPRDVGRGVDGCIVRSITFRAMDFASLSISQFNRSMGVRTLVVVSWCPLTCCVDGLNEEDFQRSRIIEIKSKSFLLRLIVRVFELTCCSAPKPSHATVTFVEKEWGVRMFEMNAASPS